uniref:Uncharacterized protein n=1 Tax=Setaria viridis TaxID=4556 RepID=A0A4U6U429_SETVI|nr:hypothetical protein SEVIR_6G054432v2 [Setaria viridis]
MDVASFLLILTIAKLAIETGSISLPGHTANLSTVWNYPSSVALLHMFPGNSSLAFAAGFYHTGNYPDDRILFGVFSVNIFLRRDGRVVHVAFSAT